MVAMLRRGSILKSELLNEIRDDMTKKDERSKTALLGFRNAMARTTENWSEISIRLVGRGMAGVTLAVALAACSGSNSPSDVTPMASDKSEVAAAASDASSTVVPPALSLKMNTSSVSADSQTDRFIIKYKAGTAERGSASAVQLKLDKLASTFPARAHQSHRMGIDADVVTTERKLTSKEAKAFMRAIAADPNVEYVEPDVPISASSIPNDPYYNLQWGLFSNLDPGQSSAGIRAANAWNIATGLGITIALVDNGVTSHSDLDANIIPQGFDFTYLGPPGGSNPGKAGGCGYVTYHGTHVAGIMAAVMNNGVGISGVAPSA
ncbi:hypothetical protein A6V36_24770 [Paraburkholderia ginsengiterrae]|uniref:Peptidase S8/S53 domain-containing protein n=1 Tax=Paraburkholderia ginsengiterrae TaxID=1462993 RepID=A0A1A9N6L4_9BURK|nr:hypothetical protein A6V37_27200 [Paraburkholderia ginsengiterrae]OAJ60879.1 hypothetical protein A6V36_24770 [Paraburkholderia ginsengiterrae]